MWGRRRPRQRAPQCKSRRAGPGDGKAGRRTGFRPVMECHEMSCFVAIRPFWPGLLMKQTGLHLTFFFTRTACPRHSKTPGKAQPPRPGPAEAASQRNEFVHIMFLTGSQEVFCVRRRKRPGLAVRRRMRPGARDISHGPHAFGRARGFRPAQRRLSFPAPSEPPPRRPEAGVSLPRHFDRNGLYQATTQSMDSGYENRGTNFRKSVETTKVQRSECNSKLTAL